MGVLVLGCQEQAGGGHIEPVNKQRTGGIGVALLQDGEDGSLAGLAGYGEHASRFVDNEQIIVLVNGFQLVGIGTEVRRGLGSTSSPCSMNPRMGSHLCRQEG